MALPKDFTIDEQRNVLNLLHACAEMELEGRRMGGLGMQNFQALRVPTFVPLAPLTLLYGPNSSGKSTIADALRFLRDLGSSEADFLLQAPLERWSNWNRDSEKRALEPFARTP